MVCFRRHRIFNHVIDRSVLVHVSPKYIKGIKGQSFLKRLYSCDASIFVVIAQSNTSLSNLLAIRLRRTFVLEEIHKNEMVKHKCSKTRSCEKQKLWRTHSPFLVEEHLSFLFYTFFDLPVLILLRPHISLLLRLILAAFNFNFTQKWTPSQIQNFDSVLVNFESF